jgi:hypothetical protein
LSSRLEHGAAGDHRLGQLAAAESIIDNRRHVQDDERENDVEPELMDVARLIGCIDADESRERTRVNSVLVLGNEAEAYLEGERDEYRNDAERAQRRMADPVPLAAQMRQDAGRPPDEARPPRGRASDEPPQQPENQQSKDRAS